MDAAESGRYIYVNNVSVPTGGYEVGTLYKNQRSLQYIINKTSSKFNGQINGNNSNGQNGTTTRFGFGANYSGALNANATSLNYDVGIGNTTLTLYSTKWFGSTVFQGAWIPDQEFYDFIIANGGI